MSRIGKLPITIPDSVDVNYTDSKITVKGKFGTLENQIPNQFWLRKIMVS
jgi:ribosomal protein L6P/L9E